MVTHPTRPAPKPNPPPEPDVGSIPDGELLRRAVMNARVRDLRKGLPHARWIAVMDVFSLGSTFSRQLCRRFNLNPDDMVRR